jgi:hypothetical protein
VEISELWPGLCKESTNGLRVSINYWSVGASGRKCVSLGVGSVVVSNDGTYLPPPEDGFIKSELRTTSGALLRPRGGKTLNGPAPVRIAFRSLRKWPDGALKRLFFSTNSGPAVLMQADPNTLYQITADDNYTLTFWPLIYKMETNGEYLDRVDLPCIGITNVFLTRKQDN